MRIEAEGFGFEVLLGILRLGNNAACPPSRVTENKRGRPEPFAGSEPFMCKTAIVELRVTIFMASLVAEVRSEDSCAPLLLHML